MKLSRCTWRRLLLGSVAVGVGTATADSQDISTGGGSILLRDVGGCPAGIATLSFESCIQDVEEKASLKGLSMIGYEGSSMLYDRKQNDVTIFASGLLDRKNFMPLIEESGGEYRLSGANRMSALKLLPGVTVCIEDEDVKKEYVRMYGDIDWKNHFKDFVMKDITLKITEVDEVGEAALVSVEERATVAYPNDGKGGEWDGENYRVRGKFDIAFQNNAFKVKIRGSMDGPTMEAIHKVLKVKVGEGKKLLYGEGCKEFALKYLKDGEAISRYLAEDYDFQQLGSIADWARLRAAVQWIGGGRFEFVKDGRCPAYIAKLSLKDSIEVSM
eukprot:GHVS01099449.1.p1 GENE.GHVS01099449.1~~GHVS01099449.1.p1  ORF type:complete len:329 (+),score=41.04 GHVS01099449.1:470-1456(+)